jgi:hypothetical protein
VKKEPQAGVTKRKKTQGRGPGRPFERGNAGGPGRPPVTQAERDARAWLKGEMEEPDVKARVRQWLRTSLNFYMWSFDQVYGKATQTIENRGLFDVIANFGTAYEGEHADLMARSLERARLAKEVADAEIGAANANTTQQETEEGETE